jgi:glucosamine--fructose-6-phosphate aminotransferase (isomerizing)
MCGIVGYYGHSDQLLEVLLGGLKRLEYRGYDSSGLAFVDQDKLQVVRSVGKIVNLQTKLTDLSLQPQTRYGIAHTRWATHGVPSEVNAHPHVSSDGKICLVHNGIIENYQDLKNTLTKQGYTFSSDTDTEVLASLIASKLRHTKSLLEAVQTALNEVRGAYAFVAFSPDYPETMVAAKFGSPLVMGVSDKETILASDVSAIIHKTKEVVYLEDQEMVQVNPDGWEIFSLDNQPLIKTTETVDWDMEAANKAGWKHFLIKEIYEQPKAINDSIRGRLLVDSGKVKFGGLIGTENKLRQVQQVSIIGIGTSYYSGLLGQMYFEDLAGVRTKTEMSPEFRYKHNIIDPQTWVIALSQSGETADTIAAILEAKDKGGFVTGVVNTVGSTIARLTEAGVYNHIGPEVSVASTKAFTSQSLILLMHAIFLGRLRNLDLSRSQQILKSIEQLPAQVEKLLTKDTYIEEVAKDFINSQSFIYIGRKYNYPIALEGALKLKELSYIHAEGLSSGELKHGFIALVDENLPTMAVVTRDSVYEKNLSNLQEVKARSGKIVAIAHEGDSEVSKVADYTIPVPDTGCELTQPILNNIAMQLFAYHISNMKGLDVDKPRNLAKSVTVE